MSNYGNTGVILDPLTGKWYAWAKNPRWISSLFDTDTEAYEELKKQVLSHG